MTDDPQAYWHMYHNELFEFLPKYAVEERIRYIQTEKPEHERELRLRLLRRVKGELPAEVGVAWQTCRAAWQAYDYDTARRAYNIAWEAYHDTLSAHRDEIEALHKQECPDCPWDGETIFAQEPPDA
jgi:hypothetical protein